MNPLAARTYAHDSWCNTTHTAGPGSCPPPCTSEGFCPYCDGWHDRQPPRIWPAAPTLLSLFALVKETGDRELILALLRVCGLANAAGPLPEGAKLAAQWRELRTEIVHPDQIDALLERR